MTASQVQLAAALSAVIARANSASDEAKLSLGDANDPNVVDPLINGATVDGSYPRGAGLGSDVNGSKALQALIEGLADYMSVSVILPPRSVILADLSPADILAEFDLTGLGLLAGEYSGYAICNGNNGTPNLSNRFPRMVTSAGGATGGTDSSAHTHPIDHNHTSATSGAPSTTTAQGTAGPIVVVASDTHTHAVDLANIVETSGAASATDNRPAFYELTALMKL